MFVRFVIADRDPDSGRRQGLFQAAGDLRRSGGMSAEDVERLDRIEQWFRKHLSAPTRFSVSTKPHRQARALGWFKDTATEHIKNVRDFQDLLDVYGKQVEMLRCERPGYVVYEDDHQVTAYPFADPPC